MIFVGVSFVPAVISVLRACCAASQRCRAAIAHPDTDPSREASPAAKCLHLGSGSSSSRGAAGGCQKGSCSPGVSTHRLLRGFVQHKGDRDLIEMGDLEVVVLQVKVGG